MGNDVFNDEQLAHAEIVQKETEEALGWWKDRALMKAEAERDAAVARLNEAADLLTDALDCIDSQRPISSVIDRFLAPQKGAPE